MKSGVGGGKTFPFPAKNTGAPPPPPPPPPPFLPPPRWERPAVPHSSSPGTLWQKEEHGRFPFDVNSGGPESGLLHISPPSH